MSPRRQPLQPPLKPARMEYGALHREEMDRVAARMREQAAQKTRWSLETPTFVRKMVIRVAALHGATADQILSGSQQLNVCAARWQVIRELREDARGFSLPMIGQWLGGLHHSTVLHALRTQANGKGPYGSALLKPPAPPVPYNPDVPDLTGEWDI